MSIHQINVAQPLTHVITKLGIPKSQARDYTVGTTHLCFVVIPYVLSSLISPYSHAC